jgi:hypothetical protein
MDEKNSTVSEILKKQIGTEIFEIVREIDRAKAPKVTGMLMELKMSKLVEFLEDRNQLEREISEALEVLEENELDFEPEEEETPTSTKKEPVVEFTVTNQKEESKKTLNSKPDDANTFENRTKSETKAKSLERNFIYHKTYGDKELEKMRVQIAEITKRNEAKHEFIQQPKQEFQGSNLIINNRLCHGGFNRFQKKRPHHFTAMEVRKYEQLKMNQDCTNKRAKAAWQFTSQEKRSTFTCL